MRLTSPLARPMSRVARRLHSAPGWVAVLFVAGLSYAVRIRTVRGRT